MNNKRIALISAGAVLLLAGSTVVSRYQMVAGQWIPRHTPVLDLTNKVISTADYADIQQALPDCYILWAVPFQGRTLYSDIETLKVSQMAPEDWATLDYFPNLSTLDVRGITDFDAIESFIQNHPDCQVLYDVCLGQTTYSDDTTALNVEDADAQELADALSRLSLVTEVTFSGQLPSGEDLTRLQDQFPQVNFHWTVTLSGRRYDQSTQQLSVKEQSVTAQELEEAISRLPGLTQADIRSCGLTDAEAKALCDRFPNCFFLWEMTIGEQVFSTDVTELDVSGIPFENRAEIERLLPYFGKLERVIMCNCGLDNETMDALNQTYPNIRFVWSIQIRTYTIRTDATYFYPYKLNRNLYINNEEASLLRYCTDMVCIDVGHMGEITDCEWAAYMPELKYLIIGETGISDLTPLSNCKKLVYLEMFTIPVTDYSPLVECTALEDLNLGKTYGSTEPITKMTWLKNLWWCGAPTRNLPCSNAEEVLPEALPNTTIKLWLKHPTAAGWRNLDNYYAMRDYMDMFYLK